MERYLDLLKSKNSAEMPTDLSKYYAETPSLSPLFKQVDFSKIGPQTLDPVAYHYGQSSKRMRGMLCLAIGEVLGVADVETLLLIGRTVEMIHCASLIIDDIEDKTETRRNQPSAFVKFGVENAINSGCFAYFFAIDFLLGNVKRPLTDGNKWRVSAAVTRMFLEGHVGNAFDLADHRGISEHSTFSVKGYEHSSMLKTSALFKLNLWLIEALFEVDPEKARVVESVVELVARGLQILNDLEAQDPNNPQFGNDLKERKMSYPMIIFWEQNQGTETQRQFIALFNGDFSLEAARKMRQLLLPALEEAQKRVGAIQTEIEGLVATKLASDPAAQAFLALFAYLQAKMSAK